MFSSDCGKKGQRTVLRCGRNGCGICVRGVIVSDGGGGRQGSRPNQAVVSGSSGAKGSVTSLQQRRYRKASCTHQGSPGI